MGMPAPAGSLGPRGWMHRRWPRATASGQLALLAGCQGSWIPRGQHVHS